MYACVDSSVCVCSHVDPVLKGQSPSDRLQPSSPTQGSKFNSKTLSMISYPPAASLCAGKKPVESFW